MGSLLKFYFGFEGRATRYDFNVRYALVMLVGSILALCMDWYVFGEAILDKNAPLVFSNLWNLLFLVPTFAVTCRRLHDLDYSGWWQLFVFAMPVIFIIALISFFGVAISSNIIAAGLWILIVMMAIVMLYVVFYVVLSCKRGTVGENRFGKDPLEKNNDVA